MLEIDNVVVRYGHVEAVKGVTLSLDEGQVVGLIGSNGAGKSTLLNTVSGLLRPSSGDIRLDGRSIARTAAHRITQAGVVQVPEGRQIFTSMSVLENLHAAKGRGRSARRRNHDVDELMDLFPILREKAGDPAGSLSGGQQQMLAIARALMCRPRLIMLDEPSLGLAPVIVDQVFLALAELRHTGVAILMVEQNAARALDFVDYSYVMERGRIVAAGSSSELIADNRIAEHYLAVPNNSDGTRTDLNHRMEEVQ